jgi:hypothetical protein
MVKSGLILFSLHGQKRLQVTFNQTGPTHSLLYSAFSILAHRGAAHAVRPGLDGSIHGMVASRHVTELREAGENQLRFE